MNRPSGRSRTILQLCSHAVKEEYKESESEVGNEILKHPAALSISYTSSLEAQLPGECWEHWIRVIIVLIISAGMLASWFCGSV